MSPANNNPNNLMPTTNIFPKKEKAPVFKDAYKIWAAPEEDPFSEMTSVPEENVERTLVLLKPDAHDRQLIGEIMSIVDQRKLALIGAKQIQMDENLVAKHYKNHIGKGFFPDLVKFMTSGPSLALVYEGQNACEMVRQLIGEKHPTASSPGSIRGRYASEYPRNLIHGSDFSDEAEYEIGLYFKETELFGSKYKKSKVIETEKQAALEAAQRAKIIAKGTKPGQFFEYPEMIKTGMTIYHTPSDHDYMVDAVDHAGDKISITVYNTLIEKPKANQKVTLTFDIHSNEEFEGSWKLAKGA